MRKILSNKIRCKSCGDIIESKHRHDFVTCSCKKCFADGGTAYLRRGYDGVNSSEAYEELSEFEGEE